RLIGAGRAAEAAALFANAVRRVRKEVGFFHDLNVPLLVYHLAALRAEAAEVPPWDPKRRRQILQRAWRVRAQALAKARTFRNNLPHALRESGLIAAMRGDARTARANLDESVALAERLGQLYEAAQSRLARGELGEALGWKGAREERARAGDEVARI